MTPKRATHATYDARPTVETRAPAMPVSRRSGGARRRLAVVGALAAAALVLTGCSAAAPASDQKARSTNASETEATAAKPELAAGAPAQASVVGGEVTITGTHLQNVKEVAFGDTKVKVSTATADKVVAVAPAADKYQPATVAVSLIGRDGTTLASKADGLQYTAQGGVAAQLQYALAHWNNYNTAVYGDLNPAGGDCANFVSQTLVARGWTMNDEWYNHDAAADWSSAWGYVPAMDEYLADNADSLGLQKLSFDQADRSKVALGDIAIFDWNANGVADHVEVVDRITKVNGQYKIELASHNDDYDFRDLDETITTQHPGAIGHFWHLTR